MKEVHVTGDVGLGFIVPICFIILTLNTCHITENIQMIKDQIVPKVVVEHPIQEGTTDE